VSHLARGDLRGVADFGDEKDKPMIARIIATVSAVLIAGVLLFSMASPCADTEDGIVRVKSAYSLAETVNRLKKDVADKGIMFFSEIGQTRRESWHQTLAIDAPSVRQSSARNPVFNLKSGFRPGLASAAIGSSRCEW
jgi:hypothetical protein